MLRANYGLNGIEIKENLMSYQLGLATSWNSFIFSTAQKAIRQLIPTGIPQEVKKFHLENLYHARQDDKRGPNVLRLSDLSFGFLIWLVACGVSSVVFMIEFFVGKILFELRKLLKKLLGLFLFIRGLKALIENNQGF